MIWPENEQALELYLQVCTQWRTGSSGVVGLDYAVVQHELSRRGLAADEYDELFAGVRVIERAALAIINKDRNG